MENWSIRKRRFWITRVMISGIAFWLKVPSLIALLILERRDKTYLILCRKEGNSKFLKTNWMSICARNANPSWRSRLTILLKSMKKKACSRLLGLHHGRSNVRITWPTSLKNYMKWSQLYLPRLIANKRRYLSGSWIKWWILTIMRVCSIS